jgi:hypothetical protein
MVISADLNVLILILIQKAQQSYSPPLLFSLLRWGSPELFAQSSLKCYPPNLSLPSGWDCRCMSLVHSLNTFLSTAGYTGANGWMDGWMDGWLDGWINVHIGVFKNYSNYIEITRDFYFLIYIMCIVQSKHMKISRYIAYYYGNKTILLRVKIGLRRKTSNWNSNMLVEHFWFLLNKQKSSYSYILLI